MRKILQQMILATGFLFLGTMSYAQSTGDYRSKAAGAVTTASNWERYSGTAWVTATTAPTYLDGVITIKHAMTIGGLTTILDQLIIDVAGTLTASSDWKLNNGTGTDMTIFGRYEVAYSASTNNGGPTLNGTGPYAIDVKSGGIYTLNNNYSGGLLGLSNNTNITYNTGSILEFKQNSAFSSSGVTFFSNNSTTKAILRISTSIGSPIGAGSSTIINGIFETSGAISFTGAGVKYFRDGIRVLSGGSITTTATSGELQISGDNAVLSTFGVNNGLIFTKRTASAVGLRLTGAGAVLESDIYVKELTSGGNTFIPSFDLKGSLTAANFALNTGNVGFTMEAGAILKTSKATGLDGTIASTGTISIDPACVLYFTGTSAQVTGDNNTPSTIGKLFIMNTSSAGVTLSKSITVSDTLYIDPASSKLNVGGNTITVTGVFTGNGTLNTTSASSLNVAGTTTNPFTFKGTEIKNLSVSRAAGCDIDNNLTVYGSVSFSNGHINTFTGTTTDTLTLASGATLLESTVAGYVIGVVKATEDSLPKNTTVYFAGLGADIQRKGNMNPGKVTVTRIVGGNTNNGAILRRGSKTYAATRMKYIIKPTTNGGLNADLTFHYFDDQLNGVSESNMNIFRRKDGSTGDFIYRGKSSQNTTFNTITETNSDSFSEWVLGGSNNPLPVDYLNFSARYINSNLINIDWTTATEINNRDFEVERSYDGRNYETIATIFGNGTTSFPVDYKAVDNNFLRTANVIYYRLKQNDYNGDYEYSPVARVILGGKQSDESVSVRYLGGSESLLIQSLDKVSSRISIRDMAGRLLKTDVITGTAQVSMEGLAKAMYIVETESPNGTAQFRIMKY